MICFRGRKAKQKRMGFRQPKTRKDIDQEPTGRPTTATVPSRNGTRRRKMGISSTPQIPSEVRREFRRATTEGTQEDVYTNPETLPSIDVAYDIFLRTYPSYSETFAIDDLRDREFFHLEENQHVCLDYCGFGLFSYYQQIVNKATASFGLAYIAPSLPTHALYGAADEGTLEFYIRKRVMNYLNINDTEYSMVFTASRGTAFKLLAESYPFDLNPKLLTVYDFESEAVSWMAECAKRKGAEVTSASFKWPSLRIGTSHLKKLLHGTKKKTGSARGLFVFPVQSRMTGAKYSYQWMSEAQQSKWHVMLDASLLGPKDMDSLGLSLFRPDFIISSFYKVFGTDPTGFGCMFIKNTAIRSLQNSPRARAVGMVRIVSLSNFAWDGAEVNESEYGGEPQLHKPSWGLEQHKEDSLRSFSGPFFPGGEPEVQEKHTIKELNHRHWKSLNRRSKMAWHNKESSVRSAGSNGLVHTVNGIGGGGTSQVELMVQPPTKSGHHWKLTASEIEEEQPNRANETGYSWEHTRHLYESNDNEIQELEDDEVSEIGNGRRSTNSQWRSQGREIQQEYSPIEFHSLRGKGISPIPEGDVEDQELEECWESDRSSKPIGIANGGAQMVVLDGRAHEIDEDAVDLDSNSMDYSGQFNGEVAEDAESMKWDLSPIQESQNGSGSDLQDPVGDELFESNLTAELHRDAANKGPSGELSDNVVKRNEFSRSMSEPGRSPIKERLRSFERRGSFEKRTGNPLSDFQEMGVQGLVRKFQSLHRGNAATSNSPPVGEPTGNPDELTGTAVEDSPGQVIEANTSEGDCDPLGEVRLVDERERSMDGNIEQMPTEESGVHNLEHSSSLLGHEQIDYEFGKEKSIKLLPSSTATIPRRTLSEAMIEERACETQEQSEKEISSAFGKEQRDHNVFSSPETRSIIEPAGEEGRLFTSRSPNFPTKEEIGRERASSGMAIVDDRQDQDFKNGRSDLHNNRTLARDVDFEDEMYPGGRLYDSGTFESKTLATVLAEDTARIDMGDSDEEPYYQSENNSGSLDRSRYFVDDDLHAANYREGEDASDEYEVSQESELQTDHEERIISCRGLDIADSLGFIRLNYRLRFLSNWLVNSLLKLRHRSNQGIPLVRIYGPKVKYDRGAAVSFNMVDWRGLLIQPGLVQQLADRSNISLGVGRLCNIVDPEMSSDFMAEKERLSRVDEDPANYSPHAGKFDIGKSGGAGEPLTIPVVTAALGFVSSFEDVYKLWSFLAKFLDSEYVSKEAWRYHSFNQQINVIIEKLAWDLHSLVNSIRTSMHSSYSSSSILLNVGYSSQDPMGADKSSGLGSQPSLFTIKCRSINFTSIKC